MHSGKSRVLVHETNIYIYIKKYKYSYARPIKPRKSLSLTFTVEFSEVLTWAKASEKCSIILIVLSSPSSSIPGNCAHFHKGGWWYNACGQTNLNGVWYSGGVYRSKFQDGIFWAEYGGGFYSLKSVRMMIRPIDWGSPRTSPSYQTRMSLNCLNVLITHFSTYL